MGKPKGKTNLSSGLANGAADEPRAAEARSADASVGSIRQLAGGERQRAEG